MTPPQPRSERGIDLGRPCIRAGAAAPAARDGWTAAAAPGRTAQAADQHVRAGGLSP